MARELSSRTSDRLQILLDRERSLKAAIAAEAMRQQKRHDRERSKLVALVGDALLRHAASTPAFKIMLQQVFSSAVTDEKSRAFLSHMGWL